MPLLDLHPPHHAPSRLDDVEADDLIGGPVRALDEHVRLDGVMASMMAPGGLVEHRGCVDARQSRGDLGAIGLGVEGPVGTLDRTQ